MLRQAEPPTSPPELTFTNLVTPSTSALHDKPCFVSKRARTPRVPVSKCAFLETARMPRASPAQRRREGNPTCLCAPPAHNNLGQRAPTTACPRTPHETPRIQPPGPRTSLRRPRATHMTTLGRTFNHCLQTFVQGSRTCTSPPDTPKATALKHCWHLANSGSPSVTRCIPSSPTLRNCVCLPNVHLA